MIPDKRRLGEILKELGYITDEVLNKALEKQAHIEKAGNFKLLGEILIEDGAITEDKLNKALLISFEEVFNNPKNDRFIRQAAYLAWKALKQSNGSLSLSKEGRLALITRISTLTGRLDQLKASNERLSKMPPKHSQKMVILCNL